MKKPIYRVFEIGQNINNSNRNNLAQMIQIANNNELDCNSIKSKNHLDPHDIKVDRFKRKSAEKND